MRHSLDGRRPPLGQRMDALAVWNQGCCQRQQLFCGHRSHLATATSACLEPRLRLDMITIRGVLAVAPFAVLACAPHSPVQPTPQPEYLYLWTGSADSIQPDFLAVLDVTEDSARYGRLVTTLQVPGLRNGPHHTEHEMPADRQLFANGFAQARPSSSI